MSEVDILIVGGGPTGLMLALELASQNISFRIFDACPSRSDKSRALALHSRSLELLNRHGIAQDFLDRGQSNVAVRIFSNKRFVFESDFSTIPFDDTMYQSPLIISQAEIESILDEVLLKHGVKVERPMTAESFLQDSDGVTATLRHDDGSEESLRCKYVVGCDGPHSVVRKSAGLKFEGAAYPQDFILADVHMKWDAKVCLHIYMGNQGFMVMFPMKDNVWRLVCSRPHQLGAETEPTLDDFQQMSDRLLPQPVELFDPVWISRFKLHHRIADNYRAGRMFVAGDAAHIHSPAGGQGMNTGIQDAVNLAWKLASVIRGEDADSLLDSYNSERRRVGKTLLQGTDRFFEFLASTNSFFLFLRNYIVPLIMPWAMSIPGSRARAYRFISQLGIRYRKSPIVGQPSTWKGRLRGGDRAPDGRLMKGEAETTCHALLGACNWTLLLFSGVGDRACSSYDLEKAETEFLENNQSVTVHAIATSSTGTPIVDPEARLHRLFGFGDPGFVLVRPDGHIAFIGPLASINELKAWMKK